MFKIAQFLVILWTGALRLYRGRGYNKFSRPLTWMTGALTGAFAFGFDFDQWPLMLTGGVIGILATWCMVKGYDGWDDWLAMLKRTWPAAGIPVVSAVALYSGVQVSPFMAFGVPAMCLLANPGQVWIRKLQHKMDATQADQRPWWAKYVVLFAELYEAVVIASACILMGVIGR